MEWLWGGSKEEEAKSKPVSTSWEARYRRYLKEERERPDYMQKPEVDAEIRAHRERRKAKLEAAKASTNPMVKFILRSEELAAQENAEALKQNSKPFRKEDASLWQSLPHVPLPNGLLMPRKAIKDVETAQKNFWDFFKHFQFGLWGYRQRPYPPEKPMDIQQVLGFKWLDKRHFDFVMRSGGWYYKDRLGRTRGPMELVNLKTAWGAGIIDKNTFVWGDDQDEWAPIGMIYGLEQAIATPDIRLATAGTDLVYKLARGIPLRAPKKGHERKSYKKLQQEALESKERENAVLRLNGGVWPGERAPSHTLFLWASGSELTKMLDGTKTMPDKFIPYNIRKKLAEEIPGLRPWEVLDIEQLMDFITFNGKWYREDLGSFTTRADYEREWFEDYKEKWDDLYDDVQAIFARVDKKQVIKELTMLEERKKMLKERKKKKSGS